MTLLRNLAEKISTALVRFAPPASQDWAKAVSAELPSIENDWAALFWALGGVKVLFMRRSVQVVSLSDVPAAAAALEKKIRKRLVLATVITLIFTRVLNRMFFHTSSPMLRVGCVLVVIALLFMVLQFAFGRGKPIPKEVDPSTRVRLYRMELERQRKLFSGALLWSRILAMIPGYVLVCIGGAIANPVIIHRPAMLIGGYVALLIVGVRNSRRIATSFARQISELDEALDKKQ